MGMTGALMTKPTSPRPFSIKLVSLLFIVRGLGLIRGFPSASTIAFGFHVVGTPAFYWHLFLLLLSFWCAIAVWRLHETGRRVAITYTAYLVLNLFLITVIPSTTRAMYLEDVMRSAGIRYTAAMLAFIVYHMVSAIPYVFALWFLIKRKSAFARSNIPRNQK